MANPIFHPPSTNPFGLSDVSSFASPVFADIDGDGDLDAFVGELYGNILYFQNTGSASSAAFASTPVTNPFGLSNVDTFASPVFADIDDDGDLDAFVGEGDGNIRYFQNTGSASSAAFAAHSSNPFGLSDVGSAASPVFADIDADGDLDAFIGESNGNILYFQNTGSASSAAFASPPSTNPFGLSDVGYNASPVFADIDGDGDLDALVGSFTSNILYFENTGSASSAAFAAARSNPFGLSEVGRNTSPTLTDIDGDGDLDAFVGNNVGNTLFFLNAPPAGVTLIQSGGATTATEGGATDSYTLVLNSQPTADVIITLDGTNSQVSLDKTSLTFTHANWNVAQTVTVTAVNDSVGEGTHSGVVKHSVSSSDTAYNGLAVANVQIRITDNDLPQETPTFQPPSTAPFGLSDVGSFASPVFADIDADGDLDALVGGIDGNIRYFQNTGSASSAAFAAASSNPFGLSDVGFNASPTLADIDGDGDLDAFVGGRDGNILYFQNTGSASSAAFASASSNPFGFSNAGNYASPTLADIDGDGDLDAFVGESNGNILYFQNTGSASSAAFAAASSNPFGLSDVGNNASPVFADIDGDGDLDAFVGDWEGKILYFQNTGSASSAAFAAPSSNPFGLSDVGSNASPILADIDGDGDLDAFVGNSAGNTLFFLNAPPAGVILTQSGGATTATEGGATGSYTLVLNSQPTADVTITLNGTNGQVSLDKTSLTFTPANWNVAQTVTVTAVNDSVGEGTHSGVVKHSVSSSDTAYNGLSVANVQVRITDNDLPQETPTFQPPSTNPFGLSDVGERASPIFADIDGDGDLDAFVGEFYGNILYFQNTGSASSAAFASASSNPFGLSYVSSFANPDFADIDGDGDLDAFVGERDGNIIYFQNTGSASSAAFASASSNPFGLSDVGSPGYANPTLADIDGDGDLDAFVGNVSGIIYYFENTGSASSAAFAAPSINPFGLSDVGSNASPVFADIDGDGDLDAFVGQWEGEILYFQNTGSASSAAFAAASSNPFGLSDVGRNANPVFADIDGDGDLDAVVGNYDGNILFFLNSPLPPTVTLSLSDTQLQAGETATLTLTFDQVPVGFSLGDISVSGGTLSDLVINPQNNKIYTATFTPSAATQTLSGSLSIAAGSFQNAANLANLASNSLQISGDTLRPTVISLEHQSPAAEQTNADSLVYRVSFSEAVTGLDTGDFSVTGTTASIGSVTQVGSTNAYDVTISGGDLANLNGNVTLAFAPGQNIADSAGNALTVTTPTSAHTPTYVVDNTAPLFNAANSSPADDASNVAVNSVLTLKFNEPLAATSDLSQVYLKAKETHVAVPATISLSANGELIITPSASLTNGTSYYVSWAAGALRDTAGNAIPAINDDTTFNFTTVAASPPPTPTPTPPPTPILPPEEDWSKLPDSDRDGVPEVVEDFVPSLAPADGSPPVAGDGNGDGIADREQIDVASIPFRNTQEVSQNPGAPIVFITLVAGSNQGVPDGQASITSVKQLDAPPVGEAPGQRPAGLELPLGLIRFTATTTAPEQSKSFSLFVEGDLQVNGYWKPTATGWVNLASPEYGGQIVTVGDKTRLDFIIVDNGPFDSDPTPGQITDPGGPGFMLLTPPPSAECPYDPFRLDADRDGMPDSIELQLGTDPSVKDNDVFAHNELFVRQLYRDLMGREGDAPGIAQWRAQLDQGGNRAELITQFMTGTEFESNVGAVARLYHAVLGRSADYCGFNYWVGERLGGLSAKDMGAAFLQSAEFLSSHLTLSEAGFIDLLYQNVLGRAADAEGRNYWLDQLAQGGTRGEVLYGFAQSDEYKQATADEVAIDLFYLGLLDRAPDQSGWDYWHARWTELDSAAKFYHTALQTPEYAQRFTTEAAPQVVELVGQGASVADGA